MMLSALLSDLVEVRRRSSGVDAIGQPIESWESVTSVWANIRHQTGLESIKADAEASTIKASIRMRYRADIDAGMRVHSAAAVYEIKAVLPDPRAGSMDLVVERVV